MVIGPGKNGITAFVILADGEFLPENLNSENVLVFRQGDSTDRQLQIIKPTGLLAKPELLRAKVKPVCNYSNTDGNPLHQHEDGSWWFYEETWNLENGPYATDEIAFEALGDYCLEVQEIQEKLLTIAQQSDRMIDDEQEAPNREESPGYRFTDSD